jgi:hypothetical protein
VYALFVSFAYSHHSWHQTFYEQLFNFLFLDITLTGTPLMLLVVYFLMIGTTEEDWMQGVSLVLVGLPLHFIVILATAHGTWYVYIPMQIVELMIAITLIYQRHKTKLEELEQR